MFTETRPPYPYLSENSDDDYTIVSLEGYREAVVALTVDGSSIGYDDLYPDVTDLESRIEQDYYDGPRSWALDQNRVYAYLKEVYE